MMNNRLFSGTFLRSICNAWQRVIDDQKSKLVRSIEQSFPFINPACQLLPAGFASPAQSSHNDDDPLHFSGILLAVPKKRRTVEKRRLRTFGWAKRMEHTQPKTNIVTCPKCGSWHESHTICGNCYDKVRQKTAEMRTQLDKDDAYYFNQNEFDVDDLLEKNQIDVESDRYRMEKQRYAEELSWFSDNLKKKVP